MERKSVGVAGPHLAGMRALVVGLGSSGQAAVALLTSRGAEVVGTDKRTMDQLSRRAKKLDCSFVLGGHEGIDWTSFDMVVVSPGVPNFAELDIARHAGGEVIGETELASRYLDVPLCAVGGTNGKSSATVLLGHLLESAEKRVFLGGNLGEPACEAPDQNMEVVVFEVSSFQMERTPTFRPHVGLLLNVSEDHLDRYDDFSDYVHAKGNCFAHQGQNDYAIYLAGSPLCEAQVARGKAQKISFGPGGDYFVEGAVVVERSTGTRFDCSDSDLHGRHNYLNGAAAIAAARVMGVSTDAIAEGLRRFRALPHRMALSGRYRGISFYDDSKATNVGAAVTALRGLTEEKGVLIAGGRDKNGSYEDLVTALREKGRGVILLGESADRLASAIGSTVHVERAKTMQSAVMRASRMARRGDAVLLSPACSSLDMFKNYSERGERFTEAVQDLSDRLAESQR